MQVLTKPLAAGDLIARVDRLPGGEDGWPRSFLPTGHAAVL
jgi:hypothetical protein